MLEMPHEHDFLILLIERGTGRFESPLQFRPSGGGGRGKLLIAQLVREID